MWASPQSGATAKKICFYFDIGELLCVHFLNFCENRNVQSEGVFTTRILSKTNQMHSTTIWTHAAILNTFLKKRFHFLIFNKFEISHKIHNPEFNK